MIGRGGGIWQEPPPPDWDQLAAALEAARAALSGPGALEASRRYCLARYALATARYQELAAGPGPLGEAARAALEDRVDAWTGLIESGTAEGYAELAGFLRAMFRDDDSGG